MVGGGSENLGNSIEKPKVEPLHQRPQKRPTTSKFSIMTKSLAVFQLELLYTQLEPTKLVQYVFAWDTNNIAYGTDADDSGM